MGVYFVLCCFDVVFVKGEGVCIRVHVYYMGCAVKCDYIDLFILSYQGTFVVFNNLCIVVYLWCYLICSVLFNPSIFFMLIYNVLSVICNIVFCNLNCISTVYFDVIVQRALV